MTSVDEQGDFVARSLRNLGVDETHLDLAVEKVFLLVLREEASPDRIGDSACLFRAAARIASSSSQALASPHRHGHDTRAKSSITSSTRCPKSCVRSSCSVRSKSATSRGSRPRWNRAPSGLGPGSSAPTAPSFTSFRRLVFPATPLPEGEAVNALEVLRAGLSAAASTRAKERTVRAIEAVSNATLLGRLRHFSSRVSLVLWLAIGLVLVVVIYELFVSLG